MNRMDHKLKLRSICLAKNVYGKTDVERYVQNAYETAKKIGKTQIMFRATPKLDGLVLWDDGNVLIFLRTSSITDEISTVFEKGVVPMNGRGQGLGEIIMSKSYLEKNQSGLFENHRNILFDIVFSDILTELSKKALVDNAVRFVPYSSLPYWTGSGEELLRNLEDIQSDLLADIDYPFTGIIFEVLDDNIQYRMSMGYNKKSWQIILKSIEQTVETTITGFEWQVDIFGYLNPVIKVSPVTLSGGETIHYVPADIMIVRNIGKGAVIKIFLPSGDINVINPSEPEELPKICPSCETDLSIQNDILICINPLCSAQKIRHLCEWVMIFDDCRKLFNYTTMKKLLERGYDSLEKIYAMNSNDFVNLGFGYEHSQRLCDALSTSRVAPVYDYIFLSAFGISKLNRVNCQKLLHYIPLESISQITHNDIKNVMGTHSDDIIKGLGLMKQTINYMIALGFNLKKTKIFSIAEQILGPHPLGHPTLSTHLSSKDEKTEHDVPHRLLDIYPQSLSTFTNNMAKCVVNHHVSKENIERDKALLNLGLVDPVKRFPINPTTQKGNWAEILLAEYVKESTNAQIPVYRLRYNPNIDQSMKGDDVLAFDLDSNPVRIIVGEAKFRSTPKKVVVKEIVDALEKSHTGKIPASLQFVADRLFESGQNDLGEKVAECNILFAQNRLQVDSVGMLVSNIKAHSHVKRNAQSSIRRLVVVSLALSNASDVVSNTYAKAESLL